jgi:hypothetical protein
MDQPERWLVIPHWPKFQHYSNRNPRWIKDYVDQLDRDEYMQLTLAQRGLLQDLRRLYARCDGIVRESDIPARILQKVPRKSLEALNHAGWIGFVASKPLSLSLSLNTEVDARARGNNENGRIPPCPLCEVGGGLHAADCPTLELPAEPS